MTTVIDPAGTPVPVFNRTGIAVVDMAIDIGPSEPIVPIPHFAGTTIARVTATDVGDPDDGGVELPASAEIGDKVEIAQMSGSANFRVYAPAGETIDGSPWANVGVFLWLRKIGSTDWRRR